jgi:hypothetical protein
MAQLKLAATDTNTSETFMQREYSWSRVKGVRSKAPPFRKAEGWAARKSCGEKRGRLGEW